MPTLKVINEDKCNGCELCVMESQRQLGRAGLADSFVRVLRNIKEGNKFNVSLDPKVNELKIKNLADICPRKVFEVQESDEA